MNFPQTDDGVLAWDILKACDHQIRADSRGPYGLDFGAILAFASARGAVPPLLVETLPDIERTIRWAHYKEEQT